MLSLLDSIAAIAAALHKSPRSRMCLHPVAIGAEAIWQSSATQHAADHRLCHGSTIWGPPTARWCAGAERYLDTREADLYWWQLALLDVYFVLLLAVLAAVALLVAAAYFVCRAARRALKGSSAVKTKAA